MAKFEEAYFKSNDDFINIDKYEHKVHYEKIFCPECYIAPMHIVEKQKTTYFASNRKDQHSKDCQHYSEFIANEKLIKLLNSTDVNDKERLNFLIKNNLDSALKNLFRNSNNTLIGSSQDCQDDKVQIKEGDNPVKYERFSIPRVSIKNIYKRKGDLMGNNIVVWGEALVESKSYERRNKETDEIFITKDLIFRVKEKYRFKIPLSGFKLKYYNELPNNPMTVGFAAFGLLTEHNGFLILKIQTTEHLEYIR